MSCGVGCRHGSDLALLWLWCRPVATALIRPLAWEPSYAKGVALKRQNKEIYFGVAVMAQWLSNSSRNHGVVSSIPDLAQWVKDPALL